MADMAELCGAIQMDLNRLKKWTNRNLRKFIKGKSKVPGQELPQAPGHAGGHPAGEQHGRKRPWVPGGHQV